MRARAIAAATVSLLLISSRGISQSGTPSEDRLISHVDSALGRLVQMQKEFREIHPFLARLHPVAVVEGEFLFIFDIDSTKGYATIFHEFIHCTQALTCENDLKQGLHVARAAVAARDYSWEINHRFPYNDTGFVEAYSRFLRALGDRDTRALLQSGRDLARRLPRDDYEYMVMAGYNFTTAARAVLRILRPNVAG